MQRKIEIDDFVEILTKHEGFAKYKDHARLRAFAANIEWGCYNETLKQCIDANIAQNWDNDKFMRTYSTKCFNVKINLDPTSSVGNTYLISRLYAKFLSVVDPEKFQEMLDDPFGDQQTPPPEMISPAVVGTMTPNEMMPEATSAIREEIELREQQKIAEKISELYQCHKCGGKKTRVLERQMRSLDEGATIFVTCIVCGFRWSHGS